MDLLSFSDLTVAVEQPPRPTALPPILLVPGLNAGAWVFERYQHFLLKQGYATYALNLRGHYGSRPVVDIGQVRFSAYVEDALEVARAIAEEHVSAPPLGHAPAADAPAPSSQPVVIGHSLGGLIAQRLAEEGVVRAAMLVCPAPPRGIPLISWKVIRRQPKYLPAILAGRPLLPNFADNEAVALNRIPAAERARVQGRFVADSGRAARDVLLGIPVDAERVRCPVLVLSGSEDHYIPPRVVRRIARRYRAPFREYFGHGHMMPIEPGWETPLREMEHWLDQTLGLGRHSTPGSIRLRELARHRGHTVQLAFRDGHVIVAKVIAVDFEEPAEIIYEVHAVMEVGPTHLAAVRPGRVAAAPLEQLRDFTVMGEGR
ncbi:MAG TPA: alpha/beta fold hydrolase [Gemmatimonadaceae bacterium]|nr:alpha/beta fold hydrolase [Gemmatimonadaceae bacterium]